MQEPIDNDDPSITALDWWFAGVLSVYEEVLHLNDPFDALTYLEEQREERVTHGDYEAAQMVHDLIFRHYFEIA